MAVTLILPSVTSGGSLNHGKDTAIELHLYHVEGDHSPRHVHIYKDAKLVLKWDLDNNKAMQGKPTKRILTLIRTLQEEGLL